MASCTKQMVTLGDRARKFAAQIGVSEQELKAARAGSTSETEGNQYLVVWAELPDGRRIRMLCPFHIPCHIVTFRPLPS